MSLDLSNYDVPPFTGFDDAMENEEVENYFEYDHEGNMYVKIEASTPVDHHEWHSANDDDNGYGLRKSLSTGNLFSVTEDKRKLNLEQQSYQVTQCDLGLKRLAKSEKKEMAENGKKFVSMAEMACKFWTQTPERFHSKPKVVKLGSTIPHTPDLRTKARSRPVTALSREQLEEMEMKEAQKHQIKAHPVNKKVLAEPKILAPLTKKIHTIPKPFKLTQMHTKKPEPEPLVPEFHARAVPKSIYTAPKQLRMPLVPHTKPLSRSSSKPKLIEKPQQPVKKRTEPEPFSFDQRDKESRKKKEELINKFLEEEKKAREFRARPIPKIVLKQHSSSTSSVKSSEHGTSSSSIKSSKSDEGLDVIIKPFKATFPKVLHQEPFVPKKTEGKPLVEITAFQLNTELRAKEREEYDKKLQEKQEEADRLRAMRDQEDREREQYEIQRLRKEAEFKANPVRRFKEVHVIPSGKITIPKSPCFIKNSKKNKENFN